MNMSIVHRQSEKETNNLAMISTLNYLSPNSMSLFDVPFT
jgi:hypothetical protein